MKNIMVAALALNVLLCACGDKSKTSKSNKFGDAEIIRIYQLADELIPRS